MKYKGYTAVVEYDDEDRVYHGRVDRIHDVVTFQADRPEDLEREFRVSVDVYLEVCAEEGIDPEAPRADKLRPLS